MARAGEGDPRWIIEDRPDSHNVNNWHWYERDVLAWSKEKISALFSGKSQKDKLYEFSVTKVSTDGISSISVRKGKLRQIFDLELSISFKAVVKEGSQKFTGTINVHEFSWNSNPDSIETVIAFDEGKRNPELSAYIKKASRPILSEAHKRYVEDLNNECTHGLILPTKDSGSKISEEDRSKHVLTNSSAFETHSLTQNNNSGGSTPLVKDNMPVVNIEESFSIPTAQVYEMFVSTEKAMMYTNSPADVQNKVGGTFSFLDGFIMGVFDKLDAEKYIEMKWRLRSWPPNYFSCAKLSFTNLPKGACKLSITHEGVLAHDLECVKQGWLRMFLKPIKLLFSQ